MERRGDLHRKLYVGTLDGVCALSSSDHGQTWQQGKIAPITNAAARLSVSPADPNRVYLAAYEARVLRTDDGGATWHQLNSYPTDYAHSVMAHPRERDTVYVGSEPAAVFRSRDGGHAWEECSGFRAVPESDKWFFPLRDPGFPRARPENGPRQSGDNLRWYRGRRNGAVSGRRGELGTTGRS